MNAEYRRDLQNNYLILEAPPGLETEDFHLKMAEQNAIPGLLPLHSARRDGILYLYYEITSKQPLEGLYEKKTMGYGDILFLLRGIAVVLESLQSFLLDPAQLIFDPGFLYVDPDRRSVQFCYYPAGEAVSPVSTLAEFLLRRLDHREQQAVVLGYGFYQRMTEENFNLHRTVREILENGLPQEGQERQPGRDGTTVSPAPRPAGVSFGPDRGLAQETGEPDPVIHRERSRGKNVREETHGEARGKGKGTKKKEKRRPPGKAERLFALIHPAVLISGLFFLALLELVFYLGLLTITEAGGIFFLLISVETLANKFWRSSKEKKKKHLWEEEEEEEMYRLLQEEMYEMPEPEPEIEETRCLTPAAERPALYLACIHTGGSRGPDIEIGPEPVYVGKVRGESDVILDSPTVSRRHARLEYLDGSCWVKDLNSRNGTFLNGRKLRPQEQCRIRPGDELAFAELRYRVVQR